MRDVIREPKLIPQCPIGRKFYKNVRKRRKRKSTRRESEYDRGQFTTEGDRDAADSLIREDRAHGKREPNLYPERRRERGDSEKRGSRISEREYIVPPPRREVEEDEIVVIEEHDGRDDRRRSRAGSRVGRVVEEVDDDEIVVITEEARREDRQRYSERMNERFQREREREGFRDEGYVEGVGERYRSRDGRRRDGEIVEERRVVRERDERRDGSRFRGE